MSHIAALLFFICIRVVSKLIEYVKCAVPHAYTIFLSVSWIALRAIV